MDEGGIRPIHRAIILGNKAFVKHLVGLGTDLKKLDKTGHTVLNFIVAIKDRKNILLFILKHLNKNADLKYLINEGDIKPLMIAINKNHLEYAKILIAHGADIGLSFDSEERIRNFLGSKDELSRLLIDSAKSAGAKVVGQLIALGADVKYSDEEGFAAVHAAAFAADIEVAKLLKCLGADFTVRTKDLGWNVLHFVNYSFERGNIGSADASKMVAFILSFCKQLMTEQDKEGIKPVDLFKANDIGYILKENKIIDSDGTLLI